MCGVARQLSVQIIDRSPRIVNLKKFYLGHIGNIKLFSSLTRLWLTWDGRQKFAANILIFLHVQNVLNKKFIHWHVLQWEATEKITMSSAPEANTEVSSNVKVEHRLLPLLMKFFKLSGAGLAIWLIGYIDFSFLWVIIGLVLFVSNEEYKKSKSNRRLYTQQATQNEKEAITARLSDLPSWVRLCNCSLAKAIIFYNHLWMQILDFCCFNKILFCRTTLSLIYVMASRLYFYCSAPVIV